MGRYITFIFFLGLGLSNFSRAETSSIKSVFVPTYSEIFHGDKESPYLLATTVTVRNTHSSDTLTVHGVDYYSTDGKLIKSYLTKPTSLGPMQSKSFFVKESDQTGGMGASFLVRWESKNAAKLAAESIMVSTKSGQGISFALQGIPLD